MSATDESPYPPSRTAPDISPARFRPQEIPLAQLEPAEWNPNRIPDQLLAKILRSILDFGIVENLVVRPHPTIAGSYEVISGNQRLILYRRLQLTSVPCHVVELDDAHARLLAQTLNRTRGSDDPEKYARLLDEVLRTQTVEDVLAYLPESEHSIDRLLAEHGLGGREAEPPGALVGSAAPPESKPGELYELGRHRLLCGDATNPDHVEELMAGERAALMATDPPYGISLDHTWRDGVRQPAGSARTGRVANDDRCDWRQAYELTDAPVAYVWHSFLYTREVWDSLEAAGFEVRQGVVWVKDIHTLSRAHYQWRHECALYAVRAGHSASWQGGRDQTTVWSAPSPIMAFGGGEDDQSTAHPTQKPLLLFEKPIRNHTRPGAVVYEPFAGSGTQLIAAQRLGRRCFAIELDPAYCDLIRRRYESYCSQEHR